MAAPIRKRITPQLVEQPTAVNNSFAPIDVDLPLSIGPAPDHRDVRAVHPTLGAGRRVWVDIQDSWEIKFKQVLRQQGLDISTWKIEQDEQYNKFHMPLRDEQGGKRRPDLIAAIAQRMQSMYQADDAEEIDSEDDKDGSDGEGDGDEDEDEDEGGDEASSDDAEDAGAGDEIDLDKEAEAEANRKKPKQQRFERYEDDFIDDSELEKVKGGPKVRTVYSGFYVNRGSVEVIEPVNKPRGRPPKPRAPAAAAAAAAAAGASKSPPAKRRKQQEQPLDTQQHQQEPQAVAKGRKRVKPAEVGQEQQPGDTSEPGAAGPKKKRSRSNTSAAADAAATAPASKRAKKGSSAEPDSGPEAAPPPRPHPAAPQAAAMTGAGAASKSVGAAAVAAARAAAAKKAPSAAGAVQGKLPLADLPTSGRSAGIADVAAAAGAQPGPQQQPTQGTLQQQTQQQPGPRKAVPMAASDTAAAASAAPGGRNSAAAMAAAFPASGPSAVAEAAEAGTAAAAELLPGDQGAEQAAAVALPEQVMSAVTALQETVRQNEAAVSGPSASAQSRTKVLGGPLLALGLAFARLPEQQQVQHTDQVLELVHQLLPHMSDKVLRRKLVGDPREKLQALQDTRNTLLQALGSMKGAAARGAEDGGDSSSDDGFEQTWSQQAEDALLTAWTAAKALGGQECLQQLAVDACSALGNTHVLEHPYQAMAELQPVLVRTKKRQKAAKEESKAAAAAAAAAEEQQQQPAEADVVPATDAQPQASHQHPLPSAAQGQSSTPAAMASAPAEGAVARERQPCGSQDSDTATDGAAAEQGAGAGAPEQADAAVPAVGELASQQAKEFSQWSAPSPRLQRCIDAAKAHGASEEWLAQGYQSIRKNSPNIHQAFRALCLSGPDGCALKDFKHVSDAAGLGFQLDDSKHIKQALRSKAMSTLAGVTEADCKKYALLAFPGVLMRPPPTSKGSTLAQSDAAGAGAAGPAE